MGTPLTLVLIGGGHTHIQVLKRHRERPFAARLAIVLDHPESVYSGMVPGFVAGQYPAEALTIDVWALARSADVTVIDAAADRIDAQAGLIHLHGRPAIPYNLVSIDIGSTVAGLDTPGVREHAIPTRPIAGLVARIGEIEGGARVVVVGGGAAGVELACAIRARWGASVVLVSAERPAWDVGIETRVGRVSEVGPTLVRVDGEEIAADRVVWATGGAAHAFGRRSDLPVEDGWIVVEPTLQVRDHASIFAVGDCAHFTASFGVLPKSGVYAVRAGPVLCDNLDAKLAGVALKAWRPQRHFLKLLNLSDGTAIGERYPWSGRGAYLWRLKDHIDRRFMRMFDARAMASETDESMACGGCAAKVGAAELHSALRALPPAPLDPSVEVGLQNPDDAAIVRIGDVRLGLTVDAFTAFCDDPYMVGRVAAVNAVNDLYAKQMRPRWALAVLTVPPIPGTLQAVMQGMREGLDGEGVSLVGGHTVRGDMLTVGLSVTGEAGEEPAPPAPGDALVLTRGLGTGVLLRANAMGRARGLWVREAMQWMQRSHRLAAQATAGLTATDITGFGLYGHTLALLGRFGLGATLQIAEFPLYPGVDPLFRQGLRSTFHDQNRRGSSVPPSTHDLWEIGFDPQTAGPLLIVIPQAQLAERLMALATVGEPARVIGAVTSESGLVLE